jgi:hypothetical protein
MHFLFNYVDAVGHVVGWWCEGEGGGGEMFEGSHAGTSSVIAYCNINVTLTQCHKLDRISQKDVCHLPRSFICFTLLRISQCKKIM